MTMNADDLIKAAPGNTLIDRLLRWCQTNANQSPYDPECRNLC